jgi:hypothetical protein
MTELIWFLDFDCMFLFQIPRCIASCISPAEGQTGRSRSWSSISSCKRHLRIGAKKSKKLFESSTDFFQAHDNIAKQLVRYTFVKVFLLVMWHQKRLEYVSACQKKGGGGRVIKSLICVKSLLIVLYVINNHVSNYPNTYTVLSPSEYRTSKVFEG